ncbi:MAG TPA: DUF423 domain-containing protein [Rariglobus sp.]
MKISLSFAAIAGVVGVSAGAFGAHALRATLLANGTLSTWNTGVLYNLVHAPAILAVCLYTHQRPDHSAWLNRACACWLIGILLFSGSLYGLALAGPRWLGPVTPLGGVFLISGWLCLVGQAQTALPAGEK